ncbi:MAG: GNAT family N-acetyltransferase [Saccharofermentanales bacterium]
MNIRKATVNDAQALKDLYFEHLTHWPPEEPQDMELWRDMLSRIEADEKYQLLVGEINGVIISSVHS